PIESEPSTPEEPDDELAQKESVETEEPPAEPIEPAAEATAPPSEELPSLPANWSPPISMSSPNASWFPTLAVDDRGHVHVTWCDTLDGVRQTDEQVYYTRWDGLQWLPPNDIVPPSPDIERHVIAIDLAGNLHLLVGGSVGSYGHLSLAHTHAPIDRAGDASAWSPLRRITDRASYMGDIAIDPDGVIHVIYDQQVANKVEIEGEIFEASSSDIYYRRSSDGGRTWSVPLNLYPSEETGSARPQLYIDSTGGLHVTFDEGWDRLSGDGEPHHGVYLTSDDGGQTWREPYIVAHPVPGAMQLTAAADGQGGVMLVWRAQESDQIYWQWSGDAGQTWGEPGTIPGLYSRRVDDTPFDLYGMTADGAGRIHLLVVARLDPSFDSPLDLYYLVWNGAGWSEPWSIHRQGGAPEYPRLVSSHGNRLHAVWFTRDAVYSEEQIRLIWYAHRQVDAPYIPPPPSPTPTATPTRTPSPDSLSRPTPFPTLIMGGSGLPRDLESERDDLILLGKAMVPVAGLMLLTLLTRYAIRRRKRST
ncbi:MAG: sialidase family protein, partial [Anaerolineae bacterium]